MKVTYNWLKDFVDISLRPAELAEKLTMAGLEVTALEECRGDWVLEIEITSNRPDWLSVLGIAREVAAITGKKLKSFKDHRGPASRVPRPAERPLSISIEDKKDCPLYTATVITGVKIGPSPDWLKKRLELLGCRPVNNVVDAVNYVLFETGQPMHAFDLGKLSGPALIVRRAKNGEKLATIDGQEKALGPQILVIADIDKVVAAAGIMGGVNSEVGQEAKDILLEAAVFDPVLIRRSRRQLGLQSESSYRFERGVPSGTLESARLRAVELIRRICGGSQALVKSCGLPPKKKRSLDFRPVRAQQILGLPQAASKAGRILGSLGFRIRRKRGDLLVEIPSWRTDVTMEADLVEEVARIVGYDNVASTLPAVKVDAGSLVVQDPVWRLKNTLVALGSREVITYSLVDRKLLECFGISCGIAEIENPLSREQEVLRPALAPSLARCLAQNLNQKQDYVNIFEISKVFSLKDPKTPPLEELNLAIALCGEKTLFMESGVAKDKMSLLHLKGMLEAVLRRMRIEEYDFRMLDACAAGVYIGGRQAGQMRGLDKNTLGCLDIKNKEVFIAEVSLEKILSFSGVNKKFKPLWLYPAVSRGISFIIRGDIPVKDILEMIRQKGGLLLEEVRVADYYSGKQIPAGSRSLTLACLYRLGERTLTESEVAPVHEGIRSLLAERFGAQLR